MARIEITSTAYAALTEAQRATLARSSGPVALGVPTVDVDEAGEPTGTLVWDHPSIDAVGVLAAAAELGVVVTDTTPAPPFDMPPPAPYEPPVIELPAPPPDPVDPVAVLEALVAPLVDATTLSDVQEAAVAAQEAMG